MNASNSRKLALPKPRRKQKPVKRLRAKTRIRPMSAKRRKEAPLIAKVRAACVKRDGYCRLGPGPIWGRCEGESTLAHVLGKRRSATRGMAPEKRHDAAWCVMLCARHHGMEEAHQLGLLSKDERGANGMVWFFVPPLKGAA